MERQEETQQATRRYRAVMLLSLVGFYCSLSAACVSCRPVDSSSEFISWNRETGQLLPGRRAIER